jgi:hypothetical protein
VFASRDAKGMLRTIAAAGIAVADLATREPALEDIFLELTGGDAK